MLPEVYAEIAEQSEDLAQTLAELEREVADRVRETLPDMRPGEAASALRNVTVSKAVNIDKASVIRGRPTEIHQDLSIAQLIAQMEAQFGNVVTFAPELKATHESTAEEIPPTEEAPE